MAEDEKEPESKEKEANKEARIPLSLPPGTIVKNRWKLTTKIGQGAFGETYAGYDLNSPDSQQVAIKVERWDNKKMVLKLEVMALKKLQPCPFVVKYISSGRQDDFNFLVMERLGENLAELRKKTPTGAFSMSTTLRLGIQMLEAIEGCHNLAYIHRDVKPSNFVIGKSEAKRRRCFLIDFGLARKYRMPGGEIRPPRRSAGFRGTARYASIQSHQSKELGRRDDLWSLFYVLVEFASGSLPWRKIKDKDEIGKLKEKYTNQDLVKELPDAFGLFMEHLNGLDYACTPDYPYLRTLLQDALDKDGACSDDPYEWELSGSFIQAAADNALAASLRDKSPHDHISDQPAEDMHQDRYQSRGGDAKPSPNPSKRHADDHGSYDKAKDAHRPAQQTDPKVKGDDPDRHAGITLASPPAAGSGAGLKEPHAGGPEGASPLGGGRHAGDRPEEADAKPMEHAAGGIPGKGGKGPADGKVHNKGCRCTVM